MLRQSAPASAPPGIAPPSASQRLQKVLAAAGLGSRRECEELILQGRVEVDRRVVTELGTRVDPQTQDIRVDGQPLRPRRKLYFAVHKPPGVVTTNRDPAGRPRVIDLVPSQERLFAVGRLDRSSEGLIFVTNDGEFANRLTHPRYGVEKTYLVRVAGFPEPRQLARLKRGVHLAEGVARVQRVAVKRKHGQSTDLVIVLNEGRNREIRRLLARVGHKVLALKRVAIGPIKLADLPSGGWRRLTPQEVAALLQAATPERAAHRRAARRRLPAARRSRPARTPAASLPSDEDARSPQQALQDEPLTLDELLRDDLDEGGPEEPEPAPGHPGASAAEPSAARKGKVIGAEAFAAPPTARPSRPTASSPAAHTVPDAPQDHRGRRPRPSQRAVHGKLRRKPTASSPKPSPRHRTRRKR